MLRYHYLTKNFLFTTYKLVTGDSHSNPQTDVLPTHNEQLPFCQLMIPHKVTYNGEHEEHMFRIKTMHKNVHAFYVIH
jgi:hypothetical protein